MSGGSRIRVAVVFGGQSAEHEVSLQSARSIVEAMDRSTYDVVLIGIDKQGGWHRYDEARYLSHADDPARIALRDARGQVAVMPGEGMLEVPGGKAADVPALDRDHGSRPDSGLPALDRDHGSRPDSGLPALDRDHGSRPDSGLPALDRDHGVDVVFPVLHGPYGEDGTIQGYLKLAGVPYVGAGVLGSAVGMDKDVTNRLLREAGIPRALFRVYRRHERPGIRFAALEAELGVPLFVKPANLGSSVGISRAATPAELERALDLAFGYDTKVVVEQCVVGREIEVAVLGNENPEASIPGEIVPDPRHGFYSYEAKYLDEHGARLDIPALLEPSVVRAVQVLACRVFTVLGCEGMARVDFFLKPDGQILVNEINTIPGFTRISMYPKLWEASGLAYPRLIERLIQLALERHEREAGLKTRVEGAV